MRACYDLLEAELGRRRTMPLAFLGALSACASLHSPEFATRGTASSSTMAESMVDVSGEPSEPLPSGFVEMRVAAVLATEGGPAVILRDHAERHLLPIWIGLGEAQAIQLRLERRRFPRPLTHDLLDSIVHDLGGEIIKVQVDDLYSDTYVGTVFVRIAGRVTHFDARPSDSIALAVGNRVPIFVSRAIIDRVAASKEPASAEPDNDEKKERLPTENLPKGVETL